MLQVLADYLTELHIDADIMVATSILVIKWTYSFSCSVDKEYATSTELTVCVSWYDFHSFLYIPKSHKSLHITCNCSCWNTEPAVPMYTLYSPISPSQLFLHEAVFPSLCTEAGFSFFLV